MTAADSTAFDFDPLAAASALARMGKAPDGTIAIDAVDWAQGAMGVLLRAEFLAADAGVVPWITLDDGTKALVTIGAARDHIADAPEGVRTLYLAAHGLVRQTHARALVWDGQTPLLQGPEEEIGVGPLVIAVIVLGVAALLATAAYLIHRDTIEIEGRSARTVSILGTTLDLARTQLATTGRIDPALYQALTALAGAESKEGGSSLVWIPWTVGGVALLAAGAWAWHRGARLWRAEEAR